jgi:BON domain
MSRLFAFIFSLPLFLGLFLSPANAATSTSRASSTQRTATPSDSQIDATIRAKLAKSKIGKDGFKFHVQHGVVTWEGSTNVIQHKGSATRMARTAGATQVINNIQISGAAKEKAAANLKKAQVVQ